MKTPVKQPNTSHAQSAKAVIGAEIEALQELYTNLPADLGQAVDILSNAKGKIVCAGIGKSGIVGAKFCATLCSFGIPALNLNAGDALHGDIGILQEYDILVVISQSANSVELERLAATARERNTSVIGVLGSEATPLAKLCNVILLCKVSEKACPLSAAPMAITTTTMALLDSIVGAMIVSKQVRREDFLKNHPAGSLGKKLSLRLCDVMLTGNNVPQVHIGSSIRDAMLEMVRCGMGAVCVLDKQNVLLGFATDADVRRHLVASSDFLQTVEVIMTQKPRCLRPDTVVLDAIKYIESQEHKFYVAPVVANDKTLLGIVRLHDLLS